MARSCAVCTHVEKGAIEEALFVGGESLRDIASRFGLSKSSLQRHRGHLGAGEDGAELIEETGTNAVAAEEEDPERAGEVMVEVDQEEAGQAAIVEAAPVKEPQKPLDPAEAQWDKFLDELERLEAEARQKTPKLREAISRLYDEERAGRQKLAALVAREAKLVTELTRLQGEELDRIERGEPVTQAESLSRVTEELASVRLDLEAERPRFEGLARQVKGRVQGLQAQIRGLEQAPAEFIGKTWKSWWWKLGGVEEEANSLPQLIQHEKRWGYPPKEEELRERLPIVLAERDILRFCVGKLASLLKKEENYLEALIQARVLPPGFEWPPKVKKIERVGPLGAHVRESWVPDPRWS